MDDELICLTRHWIKASVIFWLIRGQLETKCTQSCSRYVNKYQWCNFIGNRFIFIGIARILLLISWNHESCTTQYNLSSNINFIDNLSFSLWISMKKNFERICHFIEHFLALDNTNKKLHVHLFSSHYTTVEMLTRFRHKGISGLPKKNPIIWKN